MKYSRLFKASAVAAILMVACVTLQARTVTFNASSVSRNTDLATALNNRFNGLTCNDTAVISFDKSGTYILDGVVVLRCNVVISGMGADNTQLVLNKDDKKPLKGSDAFLGFSGRLGHPISVSIADLSIKLKEHDGIWWETSEFHAIKIYHADKVDIRNVNSTMSNAFITNFDFRVCSNVNIQDCVISNYNNCKGGGNLWLRGEMHNINIHNNKIYKYGNDEAVAFFSKTVDALRNTKGAISRTNIKVTDNEFYYQHGDRVTNGLYNDMLFSVLTSLEDNVNCCDMRGFELARNKFVIDDLCKRIIHLQFNAVDKHSDFDIHDNEFITNKVNSSETFYFKNIEVKDASATQDTIVVRNNRVTNNYAIMNPYNGSGYSFLLVNGGNVLLEGNKINNRVTTARGGKDYGIYLLWCEEAGGTVTLRSNVCKGLGRIATLESGKGIQNFKLTAYNNYFQGRTTLYCKKIQRLDLDFRQNTFESNHNDFFLQNFASRGTVVFNNNKVTVSTNGGRLMGHYEGKSSSLRFEKLEVTGNEFHGVKSQDDLTKQMTNVSKRKIKSNAFLK